MRDLSEKNTIFYKKLLDSHLKKSQKIDEEKSMIKNEDPQKEISKKRKAKKILSSI